MRKADLPMINLFADVDISIVCEEVVEGVYAGHVFQNVTASSFDRVADSRAKMSDSKQYASASDSILDSEDPSHRPDVAVILDIDVQNYHFTTQPGALRRVIMNLLGRCLFLSTHSLTEQQDRIKEFYNIENLSNDRKRERAQIHVQRICQNQTRSH